jgi:hypothetical protein
MYTISDSPTIKWSQKRYPENNYLNLIFVSIESKIIFFRVSFLCKISSKKFNFLKAVPDVVVLRC